METLAGALNGLPPAMFVVDTDLRVLIHNQPARQMVERGSLRIVSGRLEAFTPAATEALGAFVRDVADDAAPPATVDGPLTCFLEQPGRAMLFVRAVRMRAPAEPGAPPRSAVTLFVSEAEPGAEGQD